MAFTSGYATTNSDPKTHHPTGRPYEEDAAHADWARAVAFYLQADLPREAKRLSAAFLPTTTEAAVQ